MSAPEQELKDAQYVVQCRTYFHESGKKEEKAEFRPVPIMVVTLVKNKATTRVGHRKVSTVLKPKADCTAPRGGTQMFHQSR